MTVKSHARLHILDDAEAVAKRARDWLLELALASEGDFSVCLAGGSTPRLLYEKLAQTSDFPWSRAHWFWGDERFAPHDDPRSNFRMAREAFLDRAPVPAENIHPIPTEHLEPAAAAALYERELRRFHQGAARPLFNVTLLGLGQDGHTASLFPGLSVLAEREHWVAPAMGPKSEQRITLTYPALESSAHVAFLVAGADKREILDRYLGGDEALPATRLRPVGDLSMFCDAAARPGG